MTAALAVYANSPTNAFVWDDLAVRPADAELRAKLRRVEGALAGKEE